MASMFTNSTCREREREREREPHGAALHGKEDGAGLSCCPPGSPMLSKGGLRRSDGNVGQLSDYGCGGGLRG